MSILTIWRFYEMSDVAKHLKAFHLPDWSPVSSANTAICETSHLVSWFLEVFLSPDSFYLSLVPVRVQGNECQEQMDEDSKSPNDPVDSITSLATTTWTCFIKRECVPLCTSHPRSAFILCSTTVSCGFFYEVEEK